MKVSLERLTKSQTAILVAKPSYKKFSAKHSKAKKHTPPLKAAKNTPSKTIAKPAKVVCKEAPHVDRPAFQPLFAEEGTPDMVYFAHALTLNWEQASRLKAYPNTTLFQGYMLDRHVCARLAALGYDKDALVSIIGACHSRLALDVRYKYDDEKREATLGKYTRQQSQSYAQKIVTEVLNKTDYMSEYRKKFEENEGKVNRHKKQEVYWCGRLLEEERQEEKPTMAM